MAYLDPTPVFKGDKDATGTQEYSRREERHRPELRIVGRDDGAVQSSDALPINKFEECRALDYGLRFSYVEEGELPYMFILAPHDLVLAKPRNVSQLRMFSLFSYFALSFY